MKIALVGDTFTLNQGTGIARYLQELYNGLNNKFEVEIIGSNYSNKLTTILDHLTLTPLNVIKNKNDFDVFHAIAPVNSIYVPFINKPTIVTYHDISSLLYGQNSPFHVRISAPIFYRTGKFSSRVIADSSLTQEQLVDCLKFSSNNIDVVNLGVDKKFRPKKMEFRDEIIVGYVGALNARKNIDYLIMAFYFLKKNYPTLNIHLNIYGVGKEYSNLKKLVKKLKLHNVNFLGFVDDDMIVESYNSFDVFVMPSSWEGFGLPILEAQKCGVPVLIRRDASIPSEVSKCCIKVSSEIDMANMIYKIIIDDNFRKKTISDGIKHSNKFTWDKTLKCTLNVYNRAIEQV